MERFVTEGTEVLRVKRTRMLSMVTGFIVAMVLACALPAMAAASANSLIFFPVPGGSGGTYSCSSGPPFVSDTDPTSQQANCTPEQSGKPSGLTCDIPTSVTFVPATPDVPGVRQYVAGGLLCH